MKNKIDFIFANCAKSIVANIKYISYVGAVCLYSKIINCYLFSPSPRISPRLIEFAQQGLTVKYILFRVIITAIGEYCWRVAGICRRGFIAFVQVIVVHL